MYAVIKTGGKQYKVAAGQRLKIETLPAEEGQDVDFEEVLMVVDGEKSEVGAPFLEGRKVVAKVLSHGRHKKIEIIKFKRRKHHDKQMGHRQNFTEVEITSIN